MAMPPWRLFVAHADWTAAADRFGYVESRLCRIVVGPTVEPPMTSYLMAYGSGQNVRCATAASLEREVGAARRECHQRAVEAISSQNGFS
jgi:hypothetical protein